MEVALRKPAREVFKQMQKYPGCFIRKHKKRLTALRVYWRLMSAEYNPIQNITQSRIRQFFDLDIMQKVGDNEFTIKPDVTLVDKNKKKQKV